MTITRQIIYLAKRDCIEELKALLKTTIQASKEEEGCLLYDVYQTKTNIVEFIVMQSRKDEDALRSHYKTAHYLHFKENFNQYNAHVEPFELEVL